MRITTKRPAVYLATGLAVALFAACYLQAAFSIYLGILAAVGGVAAFLCRRRKSELLIAVFVASGMLLGFAAWYVDTALNYMPAVQYAGKSGTFTCTVSEYPAVYEDYTAVVVHAAEFSGEPMKRTKVLLYLDGCLDSLEPGDILSLRVSFSVPESRWNYDKFRFERAQRVFLTADALGEPEITTDSLNCRYFPIRVTRWCADRLRACMPAENAAVLSALIFGDESGLTDEYVSDLRVAGLSHITAVSGMNLSFLVGLLLLVFRRRIGSCIAVPVVLFFILMTGGSASVVRAGIMQLLWLAAYFINRETDSINSLFAACGLILLTNPFAIADVGLWLSFSATWGLILLGTPLQKAVMSRIKIQARLPRRIFETLISAFCTTIAAQIFVLPIQILVFGDLSLIAPLSNLLVVPVSEYAFTGGVVTLLFSLIWLPLGRAAALIPRLLTDFQLAVVPYLSRLPLASISAENHYLTYFVTFLYLSGLFLLWKRPKYPTIPVACILVSLCVTIFCTVLENALLLRISVVDTVGGQSVVLCDPDAAVVVNCGGGYESACATVLEELRRSNVRKVTLLILTDYRGASAGNAETLLKSFSVETIVLPEPADESSAIRYEKITAAAREEGTEIVFASKRDCYAFGNVTVRLLENREPGGDFGRLTVYLEVSGYHVLCLGSVYPENVGYLLLEAGIGRADLVAAGDYYAARMVPPAALRFEPELCVFSSYFGANRDVVERVSAYVEAVAETERMGCVRVDIPRLYGMAK